MSKKEKKEPPTCPVCMDHFTAVIRQPITCPYCPSAACRQCTSQYLLTTLNDPHCIGCRREWNREFIDTKLTQTFRKGPLRVHRRKVLIDREKGRLPAMQIFVEAQYEYDQANKVYTECRSRRVQLKRQRNAIQAQYAPSDTLEQLTERLRPLNQERMELKTRMRAAEEKMRRAYATLTGRERETRQFIMKCPSEGCRGFLSSAWKCGTCQKFFCADCHAEKANQRDEAHTCNEDAKATASMIRQETRPCPKCGIRISKIDGCDQMWCTACQTTFSWNTGQVLLNTIVHNPHYYEYLRRTNGGVVPREAGDVPCGGLPQAYIFTRLIMEIPHQHLTQLDKTEILDIVRCLSDIQYVRLPQFPLRQAANVNQGLDVKYLMKDISEEEWGTALERVETNFERKKEIGLILQTLLHVGSEKLTQLQNARREERNTMAKPHLEELKQVRAYTNKCLIEKGLQMGVVVPHITRDWRWSWIKKGEMKNRVDEVSSAPPENPPVTQGVTAAPVRPPPAAAPVRPPVVESLLENEEEASHEDTVMVEIGGEIIEMTARQAQQILV
jgi:hypothetical protein